MSCKKIKLIKRVEEKDKYFWAAGSKGLARNGTQSIRILGETVEAGAVEV